MSDGSGIPLDRDAVAMLAKELLEDVRDHYLRRPTSRATAQEVLNALAINVAMIVAAARACGDEDGARQFFDDALEAQLDEANPTTLGELERVVR